MDEGRVDHSEWRFRHIATDREQPRVNERIRIAKGLDPSSSEAIVIVDETTPYRLLIEVLYTLGASSFGKYHLMVISTKKLPHER